MGYRSLYILVEGNDDIRFFEKIIKPKLEEKYNSVEIKTWAVQENKVDSYINSFNGMKADYFFVGDIDSSPCVTAKKQKIKSKHYIIDEDRIIVVIKEIESWYLAGLDEKKAKQLGIRNYVYPNTNTITKEQFNELIPRRFGSRIDFLLEILKLFSAEIAKGRNESFRYFIDKCN